MVLALGYALLIAATLPALGIVAALGYALRARRRRRSNAAKAAGNRPGRAGRIRA